MTPAPLFGLLLSLLGVGGLPEIVKIGERIFWSCCSLLDVHKNNIFSKQPGGLFDVSEQAESNQETAFRWVLCGKDHNTEAAKYNSWKSWIYLRAICSFLQSCSQVRGWANQRAGQDSQLLTTLGSDWEDSAWGLIPCFEERCSVLLSTQYSVLLTTSWWQSHPRYWTPE